MDRLRPIESEQPPRDRMGCGCGFGEFLMVLFIIGIVSVIALLTLGGGYEMLMTELPRPSAS